MNEIPQTRQSLLLELGKQSDHAWSEFLAIYEDALLRFCMAKGLQEADARDVIQDVFAAVLKRIPSWDADTSKGSFRGWLFRVAKNIVADAVARRAREATVGGDTRFANFLSQVPNQSHPHETTIEAEYQRSLVAWASAYVQTEVKEITWQSFILTAIEGQKPEQVATTLGISVGSVYTAKCRVVARIRAKIAQMDDGQEQNPS
jgi:RNA polymerase sigma factor (sigma-70 family)